MPNRNIQFSIQTLALATVGVAIVVYCFVRIPGWTIVVLSCLPFLTGSYYWLHDKTRVETRIKTFPLLCIATIPAYIASMGPALANDGDYVWGGFYRPIVWVADGTVLERPAKDYLKLWGVR